MWSFLCRNPLSLKTELRLPVLPPTPPLTEVAPLLLAVSDNSRSFPLSVIQNGRLVCPGTSHTVLVDLFPLLRFLFKIFFFPPQFDRTSDTPCNSAHFLFTTGRILCLPDTNSSSRHKFSSFPSLQFARDLFSPRCFHFFSCFASVFIIIGILSRGFFHDVPALLPACLA